MDFAVSPSLILGKSGIGIAIKPALTRLGGSDDWVPARPRVFAGVLIRRAIATQRHTTLLAGAQMHPLRPDLHTLRALVAAGKFNGRDSRQMYATSVGHNLHRFQILVNELTFANWRSDPFGRTGTHISRCEHTRPARFQQKWLPFQGPVSPIPTFGNAIAFRSCGHYSDSRFLTMNTQLLADGRSVYSPEDNGLKARWARRLPACVLSAP